MKERLILFNGEMVRAILAGRKTQTRRLVKAFSNIERYHHQGEWRISFMCKERIGWATSEAEFVKKCPYGEPGDRLWVKEGFWQASKSSSDQNGEYTSYWASTIEYAEQRSKPGWHNDDQYGKGFMRRRPSIHMPRWASRLTLEVVSVRVERLQAISEADAQAEGVEPYLCPQADALMNAVGGGMKPIPFTSGFANVWRTIHGSDAWAANPWVWVVEFRRVGGAA